jgi:hypothetical protein
MEHLNPRGAKVVGFERLSGIERGQLYFQRYIQHLLIEGEIVPFDIEDRSNVLAFQNTNSVSVSFALNLALIQSISGLLNNRGIIDFLLIRNKSRMTLEIFEDNTMPSKYIAFFLLSAFMVTGTANANVTVTNEDFLAQKTQNLINLCTASPQDPLYREAIHFCHGYLVGAYHYYQAETSGKQELKMFCVPEPKPTRNETIAMFISWAQQHPEYMEETPVDTEFRFLTEKWPCKK